MLFVGEFIVTQFLRFNAFPQTDIYQKVSQFFPLTALSNLIKEPFTRLSAINNIETTIAGEKIERFYGIHFSEFSIAIMWIFIFILTSYWIVKKRDL